MTGIILHGCLGAMAQAVRKAAADYDVSIVAGISGGGAAEDFPFPVFDNIGDCRAEADVILDFSLAGAVTPLIRYAVARGIPTVVCTTGLSHEQEAEIAAASKTTAMFRAANMSLGINLLTAILRKVSKTLYNAGFEVEIMEKHHNRKIDAPSGTAHLLGDTINTALDGALTPVYDRSQRRVRRGRNELGYSAIRGGTVCGEHSVMFYGNDEVIEFKHTSFSRELYAVGALNAVRFIKDKPPGLYTMDSLINMGEL